MSICLTGAKGRTARPVCGSSLERRCTWAHWPALLLNHGCHAFSSHLLANSHLLQICCWQPGLNILPVAQRLTCSHALCRTEPTSQNKARCVYDRSAVRPNEGLVTTDLWQQAGRPHCLSGSCSGRPKRSGGTCRRPTPPWLAAAAGAAAGGAAAPAPAAVDEAADAWRPRLLSWRGRPRLPRSRCCCSHAAAAACSLPRLRGVADPSASSMSELGSRSERVRPSGGGLVASCSVRSFLPSCEREATGGQGMPGGGGLAG